MYAGQIGNVLYVYFIKKPNRLKVFHTTYMTSHNIRLDDAAVRINKTTAIVQMKKYRHTCPWHKPPLKLTLV